MSTDIKLSKVQIKKIIQSGGFLGKLIGPLLKTGLPLLKSVIKPLGLLGLTAASSAIDAGIQKKVHGSGSTSKTTTLIIPNKEMNGTMKIIQALENSGILLKGVTKTIKDKRTKRRFSWYVIRYFRSIFIRKFIVRKRNYKSRGRN